MLDRVVGRILAALVGDSVRAILGGALILAALGRWLGWWSVAALASAVALDLVRWPRAWRWW